MKVAYSQFKVKDITCFEDFCAHVSWHLAKASDDGADLILFPEFCTAELLTIPGVYSSDDPATMLCESARLFTDRLHECWRAFAAKYHVSIVAGTHFCYDKNTDKYYNTAFIYGRNGEFFQQSKTHLSYELVYNKNLTTPGDALRVFTLEGVTMGIAICYDNSFPEVARELSAQGAQLILAPSCCLDEWGKHRNILFARARATENLVYVVNAQLIGRISFPRSNPYGFLFTGQSGTYAPMNINFGSEDGILLQAHSNEESVGTCTIESL